MIHKHVFSEKVPANQSTTQEQKSFVDIGSSLVTDAEAAELIQPGECSLYDPAPSPQAATMPRVARCQERSDATDARTLPDSFCIVGAIAQKAVGATARASTFPLQRGNSINELQSLPRVVNVRSS